MVSTVVSVGGIIIVVVVNLIVASMVAVAREVTLSYPRYEEHHVKYLGSAPMTELASRSGGMLGDLLAEVDELRILIVDLNVEFAVKIDAENE